MAIVPQTARPTGPSHERPSRTSRRHSGWLPRSDRVRPDQPRHPDSACRRPDHALSRTGSADRRECKGAGFAKTGKAEWDSWELVEANLNRYLVPALGSRSIHHVTDTDIANITKKIVAGGHPQAANTAFWYMRAFFNWCRKPPQRLIAVSPRGIGKSGIRPRSSSASEW